MILSSCCAKADEATSVMAAKATLRMVLVMWLTISSLGLREMLNAKRTLPLSA
jgi:hypothetical protein